MELEEDLQRDLNDHLALIRILEDDRDTPPIYAFDTSTNSNRQRRQILLNFIAFCLTRDGNTVALATTIQSCDHKNKLVLHVARQTGHTTSYERERAKEFLRAVRRAWRVGNGAEVWADVVLMTAGKLKVWLEKLRKALRAAKGFGEAVDVWARERDEVSTGALRWMHTWNCPSQVEALKDVFRQLSFLVETEDFAAPEMYASSRGLFRLHHSYFVPIGILADSTFLHDVECGKCIDHLHKDVVRRLQILHRRCLKLYSYEIGVHLLCTFARDSVRRILGPAAFTQFVSCEETESDAFWIDWLDTPRAMAKPTQRVHDSAQDALLCILAEISDSDSEPFACTIAHRPCAQWSPRCAPMYHPELQIIDYLRARGMRASPAYVGCAKRVCRACRFYVDQLDGLRWTLNTEGRETMELKVPEEWMIPLGEAGKMCAVLVREEAARLVLREDDRQRVAWEMWHTTPEEMLPEPIPPWDYSL